MAFYSVVLFFLLLSISSTPRSLADSSLCHRSDLGFFASSLRSQCPLSIERSSAEEVSGDTLDRELIHDGRIAYYSVLFYASWCPFSSKTRPTFDALSTMFPQIKHVAIEESSAMPSVFSRYGIHSFPSILIANGSTRVQYHGSKDLNSLVHFYSEVTGFEPVLYLAMEPSSDTENLRPLNTLDRSLREIMASEPYLTLSILFICLKAFVCFFPLIISRLKAFLAVYVWKLNLGIFGEWSQLLERVLHGMDLKRLWSKLRLSKKTRNFQKGANNARVWASSLASVSLGESTSSRDS
ncbi:5'-adenylylsulfate reductase-like 5 isoform X2 [Iris pallida]|uniref:5'-adenylylsulfate reductase-like 5 isoform X2 n=1 Tax=Iris pallida TaxID=29817 RepID=A0AAX6IGE5_IRIPA|nr:5'-adenylylsulfate reductase-like 5 isoform X2 [Iris pallida]KAJ6852410.1 5'-adenylylsulfate reductase-like 5 isoform X2 [Iris pallida]